MRNLIAVVLLAGLAGCSSLATAPVPPDELAARICPPLVAAISVLDAPGVLDETAAADVQAAGRIVNAVCAGDSGQQNRLVGVLPLLRKALVVAPLDPADRSAAIIGLAVAESLIGALQ